MRRFSGSVLLGLNAPYGAPCFLTVQYENEMTLTGQCLNAPYGAPCFLTREWTLDYKPADMES